MTKERDGGMEAAMKATWLIETNEESALTSTVPT